MSGPVYGEAEKQRLVALGRQTLRRAEEVLRKGEVRWGEGRKDAEEEETAVTWYALSAKARRVLEAEAQRTGETVEDTLHRIVMESGRRRLGAAGA